MNVLYFIDYDTVGGATMAFITMIRQMQKLGVTPIVVTSRYNNLNEYLDTIKVKNISDRHLTALEVFSFTGFRWPWRLLKNVVRYYYYEFSALKILSKQLDFKDINIIHTNSARNTIGARISKKYSIPHIVHIREFGDKDFSCVPLTPRYINILNRYTNIFLSVSQAVQEHWNSKGIDADKNVVIYDGVVCSDITKSSKDDKLKRKLHLVINGGVCTTKGQYLAIEAISFLPKQIRDNILLDIVGWYGEKYIRRLKSYTKSLGCENYVNFLGARDDVHRRMNQYQIGLMCSKSEGFGLVTAEYMHGQLGVIASDSGACPELIDDGRTGLLFKSGDSRDLSRCIELLYNDRDLLVRLSENAREEASNRFTAEINANNIYKVYQEIIKNK